MKEIKTKYAETAGLAYNIPKQPASIIDSGEFLLALIPTGVVGRDREEIFPLLPEELPLAEALLYELPFALGQIPTGVVDRDQEEITNLGYDHMEFDLPNTIANVLSDHNAAAHAWMWNLNQIPELDWAHIDEIFPKLIADLLSDHNKATHDALGLSHDSLVDVSTSDHHVKTVDTADITIGVFVLDRIPVMDWDHLPMFPATIALTLSDHDLERHPLAIIPTMDDDHIPDVETLSYTVAFALEQIPNMDWGHISDIFPKLIADLLSDHDKAAHDALALSHDSLSDVSTSDHHVKTVNDEVYGLTRYGLLAARPAAELCSRLYYATDTKIMYHDSGDSWVPLLWGLSTIPVMDDDHIPDIDTLSGHYTDAMAIAAIEEQDPLTLPSLTVTGNAGVSGVLTLNGIGYRLRQSLGAGEHGIWQLLSSHANPYLTLEVSDGSSYWTTWDMLKNGDFRINVGGLLIGADTNLFRKAANELWTNDNLHVGNVEFNLMMYATEAKILFGDRSSVWDVNLYRHAANWLRTDDGFYVGLDVLLGGETMELKSITGQTIPQIKFINKEGADKIGYITAFANRLVFEYGDYEAWTLESPLGTSMFEFDKDGWLILGKPAQDTQIASQWDPNTSAARLILFGAPTGPDVKATFVESFRIKSDADIQIASARKLYYGTDVNLYRSAANILKTDDTFEALALRINGTEVLTSARVLQNVTANASIITAGEFDNDRIPWGSVDDDLLPDLADLNSLGSTSYEWLNLYIGNIGKIYFGLDQDVNLYRSAANVLKTDDSLEVGGALPQVNYEGFYIQPLPLNGQLQTVSDTTSPWSWYVNTGADNTIGILGGMLAIGTPATNNNAIGVTYQSNPLNPPTWDKDFISNVCFYSQVIVSQLAYIGRGEWDCVSNDRHVGFKLINNALYGSTGNGAAQTNTFLLNISATTYYRFKVVFIAGTSAKFYVNGTYYATITTNLPAGAGESPTFFPALYVKATAAAAKQVNCNEARLNQLP